MTKDEFRNLKRGDIVQNKGSGISYVVDSIVDDKLVLVRTLVAENPDEWNLVSAKADNCETRLHL